jgi:hypothetical protein
MSISNIDELLIGGVGNSQQPATPEHHDEPEPIEEHEPYTPEYAEDEPEENTKEETEEKEHEEHEDTKPQTSEIDEYGNEQEPENEAIRERLARQARKHEAELNALRQQLAQQGASQDIQQAAKDFEYDPDAGGDWQQQLASFVKQTVNSMSQEQEQAKSRQQEQQIQQEFESKFRDGMNRFDDFREVMTNLPFEITNPMTLATRAMDNPAAFLYAAAKRNPQELERISKIRDPYAQMTEMGKLEERMRKNKPTTKAPRPIGRMSEDSTSKSKPKAKESNGDDLLARADAKRLATVKQRLKGNR